MGSLLVILHFDGDKISERRFLGFTSYSVRPYMEMIEVPKIWTWHRCVKENNFAQDVMAIMSTENVKEE